MDRHELTIVLTKEAEERGELDFLRRNFEIVGLLFEKFIFDVRTAEVVVLVETKRNRMRLLIDCSGALKC